MKPQDFISMFLSVVGDDVDEKSVAGAFCHVLEQAKKSDEIPTDEEIIKAINSKTDN